MSDRCVGGRERSSLYEIATETWGEDPQIDMVAEESAELAAEVCRYWRGRADLSEFGNWLVRGAIKDREFEEQFGGDGS